MTKKELMAIKALEERMAADKLRYQQLMRQKKLDEKRAEKAKAEERRKYENHIKYTLGGVVTKHLGSIGVHVESEEELQKMAAIFDEFMAYQVAQGYLQGHLDRRA